MSDSLGPHGLYSPWNSPGQDTWVGSLSLLQGIFPTQGLNPGFLHCGQILYQLSHKGSPRILEWVAYPFSSGSSWPRSWTGISCIADAFFTNWAMRGALIACLRGQRLNQGWYRFGLLESKSERNWCLSWLAGADWQTQILIKKMLKPVTGYTCLFLALHSNSHMLTFH